MSYLLNKELNRILSHVHCFEWFLIKELRTSAQTPGSPNGARTEYALIANRRPNEAFA